MKNLYIGAWRLFYFLSLPATRLKIRSSHRAYVLLIHQGEALLIRDLFSDHQWKLPGGGAHDSEGYEQAAWRETREELGLELELTNLKPLAKGIWHSHKYNCPYQIFQVKLKDRPHLRLRKGEIYAADWFNKAALKVEKLAPEIAQAIALADF